MRLPTDVVYEFLDARVEITPADWYDFPTRNEFVERESLFYKRFKIWAEWHKKEDLCLETFNFCIRQLLPHVKFCPAFNEKNEKDYLWKGLRFNLNKPQIKTPVP